MFSGTEMLTDDPSFEFGDFNDIIDDTEFTFDSSLSNVIDDPNIDLSLFGLSEDILPEPSVDTSDSDSGISNHGDRQHPFLCDVEQGNMEMVQSNVFSIHTSCTNVTNTELPSTSSATLSLKRPRPQEPLITASAGLSKAVTILKPSYVNRIFSHSGAITLVKSEPSVHASIVHHTVPTTNQIPPKIPRILSRSQAVNSTATRSLLTPTTTPKLTTPVSVAPAFYSSTNAIPVITSRSHAEPQQQGRGDGNGSSTLLPAVMSLPVIDEFTFSNSFQVIAPPPEPETYEKMIKKQERMIKNRQAACLSRLRKKEYLERLEHKLDQLKQENAHLRQENNEWRRRYSHLERCLDDLQTEFAILRRGSEPGGSDSSLSPPALPSPSKMPPPSSSSSDASPPSMRQQQQPFMLSTMPSQINTDTTTGANSDNLSHIVLQQKSSHPGVVSLPRGMRKKVTTSLFVLVCICLLNLSALPPLGQLGASLASTALGGAKTFGIMSPGYGEIPFRAAVGGRTLLSLPSPNGEVAAEATDTDVLSQPPVNRTLHEVPIEHCMPGDFFDSHGRPVWIVFDADGGIEKPDIQLTLHQRLKHTVRHHHANASAASSGDGAPSKGGEWPLTKASHLASKKVAVYLVYSPSLDDDEDDEGYPNSLYLLSQSNAASNLTVFLQNNKTHSPFSSPHLASNEINATEEGLRLCKLQVRISTLSELRRRRHRRQKN